MTRKGTRVADSSYRRNDKEGVGGMTRKGWMERQESVRDPFSKLGEKVPAKSFNKDFARNIFS